MHTHTFTAIMMCGAIYLVYIPFIPGEKLQTQTLLSDLGGRGGGDREGDKYPPYHYGSILLGR